MERIGLFYGSDTGVTENIVERIKDAWDKCPIDVYNIADWDASKFQDYDIIFLGLSTWYYGELQSDWEDIIEDFKKVDFTGKTVALFGCGDQYGYDHYFIDGVGIVAKIVLENGGKIIGHFPTVGFDHEESKAMVNENMFYGLAIDEDNEPERTDERIAQWISILEDEWHA